jgi:hypothetical protein
MQRRDVAGVTTSTSSIFRAIATTQTRWGLIRKILLTREPEIAQYPTAVRLYNRFLATSTTLSRKRPSSCTAASKNRAVSTAL